MRQASVGDHAAAAVSFQRLVALQPENGMALHNLGKSLFELGQVDPALEAFRRSLGNLPQGADCLALGNIAVAIPGSPSARATGHPRSAAGVGRATVCLPLRPPENSRADTPTRTVRSDWATSPPSSTSGTG